MRPLQVAWLSANALLIALRTESVSQIIELATALAFYKQCTKVIFTDAAHALMSWVAGTVCLPPALNLPSTAEYNRLKYRQRAGAGHYVASSVSRRVLLRRSLDDVHLVAVCEFTQASTSARR